MDRQPSILIVDDEESIRRGLTLILGKKGYETQTAATGQEALQKAQGRFFNLSLLDIRLPDMEGIELVAPLKDLHPDMAVIMTTGYASLETAVQAMNRGVSAYLTKPLNMDEMLARIREALEKQRLIMENRRLYREVQRELAERERAEEALQQSFAKLQSALEGTIHVLASAAERRDPYTAGHQHRVAGLAGAIAEQMGLPPEQQNGIRMAGMVHDIGKIAIPAEILSKPGRLSHIELDLIKSHSEVGYDILKDIAFPWPIAEMVYQHHERMDGSGYPRGLSGEAILLEARILSVADVMEAMSSHRPYRPAFGMDKALEEVSQHRGGRYDSQVVDACLKVFIEKGMELGPEVSYPSRLTDVDVKSLLEVSADRSDRP